MNLPESPVVFEPEHHTYNLNGKMLSGVTAIVKWLFPDTYAGIPESVLMKNAADDAEYSSKLLAREGKLFAGLLATRFKGFAIGACIALLFIVIIPALAKAMGL